MGTLSNLAMVIPIKQEESENYVMTHNDFIWSVVLGDLLLILTFGLFIALGWTLLNPLQYWDHQETTVPREQVVEVLATIFAAGLGCMIYTIRAYLIHVCQKRDFDYRYFPWYFFRVIMGILLGLVFYFAIRGGILFLTVTNNDQTSIETFNIWSLAAIGSLVGLFSKYVLAKLREVFVMLFKTREDEKEEWENLRIINLQELSDQ